MKKFLLLVLVAFVSSTMSAQLVTSTTITKKQSPEKSYTFMEAGVGTLGGDIKNDGISLDLGFGYRKEYTQYLAWDILKIKAIAEISNLEDTLTPQLMTGVRGTSPVLFGNVTGYASFSIGYGHNIKGECGGLAYEAQIGLNLTSKLSLGLVYDNQSLSYEEEDELIDEKFNYNVSFTGIRLGLRF